MHTLWSNLIIWKNFLFHVWELRSLYDDNEGADERTYDLPFLSSELPFLNIYVHICKNINEMKSKRA